MMLDGNGAKNSLRRFVPSPFNVPKRCALRSSFYHFLLVLERFRFFNERQKIMGLKIPKIPNPIAVVANAINKAFDQQLEEDDENGMSSAPVPVNPAPPAPVPAQQSPDEEAKDVTIVTGRFVPQDAGELYTQSTQQTERFRKIVDKFDEDRMEPIEWVIRKGASLFCYVSPFVLAVPVGIAVGDAFTPQKTATIPAPSPTMAFAIHLLSVFLEVIMPILGLATTIAFKRAMKDRSQMAGAVVIAFLFVFVSIGNALALLFLMEKGGIVLDNPVATVGIIGRSFGSFIVDVGSTVYLTVSGVKSLAKYLADQRAKIVAVKDVNAVHIDMEATQIRAAIDRQSAIMDMQSKQQRAQTWNQIEEMQSKAMIDQARRSFEGGGDGYRRSRF
jgi:hypothetical protein